MVLIDNYSEGNQDDQTDLKSKHPSIFGLSAVGQSFTCDSNNKITEAKFYLKKTGSPTGNAHAVLYAHSGTYGTSSVPTGSALATSDDFDISTLTTSFQLITFTFSGSQQYRMAGSTYYCIAFLNPTSGTINSTDYVIVGVDKSSPTHDGNYFQYGAGWVSTSLWDDVFYVYGTPYWGGKVLGVSSFGVPTGNLGKINGVPIEDLAKVMGIPG